MAIVVAPYTVKFDEPNYVLTHYDFEWIKATKVKMSKVYAVKLVRLMTKCDLKTAINFVESIPPALEEVPKTATSLNL